MRKVIAAIDASVTAEAALATAEAVPAIAEAVLATAEAVAGALGASVEVVHVIESDGDPSPPDVGVPVRTLTGDPTELLARTAAEEDVVAIVLGARNHEDGPRPAGHVAMAVADRTNKPVVLVPPGARPPAELHTVVVAMEGTPAKARALQRSIDLSARAGLEIVVVHVEDEDSIPSFSDQVQHETEIYAEEFFARHLIGAPQMRLELRFGSPASEVLGAIESARAELVTVGWPPPGVPGRGAVAREIVARSPVPVVLVALT